MININRRLYIPLLIILAVASSTIWESEAYADNNVDMNFNHHSLREWLEKAVYKRTSAQSASLKLVGTSVLYSDPARTFRCSANSKCKPRCTRYANFFKKYYSDAATRVYADCAYRYYGTGFLRLDVPGAPSFDTYMIRWFPSFYFDTSLVPDTFYQKAFIAWLELIYTCC